MRPKPDFLPRMRGATGSVAGRRGLVPKPAAADNVKFLKGDGSWSALSNASAATDAEAAAGTSTSTFVTPANAVLAAAKVVNPRAPRQALAFNGTAGASFTGTNTAFGTGDFAMGWIVKTESLATTNVICSGPIGALTLYVLATGAVLTGKRSDSDNTPSTAGVIAVGKYYLVTYSRASGVGTYYVNGVSVGTTTDTKNYSASLRNFGCQDGGGQPFYGALCLIGIYNRAFSAAEVLALYEQGAPAEGDYNSASNTAINTSSFLDGIAGTSGFVALGGTFSGASATGFSATSIAPGGAVSGSLPAFTVSVGQRIRVTYTATITSGTPKVALFNSAVSGIGATAPDLVAGTNTIEITATSASTTARIAFYLLAAGDFSVSNVSITRIGLLCAPEANAPGAGLEWLDASGNRAHIVLPTSGVTWALPSQNAIVIEATTNTATNQQLGGASLIDTNKQWRIQSWTVNCSTGTPTISLGNVSAGAQYVSAAVLAAGNNDITLLTRFPSAANLWCNSSTTATLIHRIVLVPAN